MGLTRTFGNKSYAVWGGYSDKASAKKAQSRAKKHGPARIVQEGKKWVVYHRFKRK